MGFRWDVASAPGDRWQVGRLLLGCCWGFVYVNCWGFGGLYVGCCFGASKTLVGWRFVAGILFVWKLLGFWGSFVAWVWGDFCCWVFSGV